MSLKNHFELLAAYNQRMNSKVYEAAGHLSATDLAKDRGAFFGSILGTLNHILVGDTIWLKRFATHPSCLNSLREVADIQNPTSLEPLGLSVTAAAEALGVSRKTLSAVLNGKAGISPEMAIRLLSLLIPHRRAG
ncbi:HigA family addiction module antitoxin [Lacimicrobium alkaliphilum]|uniref:HTH cro/C1-type domain-containing protein n=1 Tax=Lacimicrobium alkaliphilum TaxID=1526571 RepID=A0ABQ1RQP8_9ALTE|nr:HigA family addiction module antitoxin [Lacimicrobium alkaliphilum]GGD78581.1 hypothetical protein GCM10011357_36960 [Lacimicrobium alkaliphilum]